MQGICAVKESLGNGKGKAKATQALSLRLRAGLESAGGGPLCVSSFSWSGPVVLTFSVNADCWVFPQGKGKGYSIAVPACEGSCLSLVHAGQNASCAWESFLAWVSLQGPQTRTRQMVSEEARNRGNGDLEGYMAAQIKRLWLFA
eukprot:1161904-Pelagomonas_calceolata.AAC.19